MPKEFLLPDLGEGIAEAQIVRVMIKPGEKVARDQSLMEVETDKASFTVEADVDGVVLSIPPQINDLIEVGSVLLWTGSRPDEPVPDGGPARHSQRASTAPTVKASQLLAKYGLQASDVPCGGERLGAADVEAYVARQGLASGNGETGETPGPIAGGRFEDLADFDLRFRVRHRVRTALDPFDGLFL